MKKAIAALIVSILLGSNGNAAGLSMAGFSAGKLNRACSQKVGEMEFLACMVYFAGWLDGVIAQQFNLTVSHLRTVGEGDFPRWAKSSAYQCFDLRASEEELGKKFTAWYAAKLSTLRQNDASKFESVGAGTAIANMMRDLYPCGR